MADYEEMWALAEMHVEELETKNEQLQAALIKLEEWFHGTEPKPPRYQQGCGGCFCLESLLRESN